MLKAFLIVLVVTTIILLGILNSLRIEYKNMKIDRNWEKDRANEWERKYNKLLRKIRKHVK